MLVWCESPSAYQFSDYAATEFMTEWSEIVTAIKELPYSCGYCYTQVTDVQQEINGLMDIDRNYKIDPEIIREINERTV